MAQLLKDRDRMPTPAQLQLIPVLRVAIARDSDERIRRWGNAEQVARERARAGYLLIGRDWTADYILSDDAVVLAIPTDPPGAPEIPSASIAHAVLFRALHYFPELLSLIPARPSDAQDCPDCSGTGVHEATLESPRIWQIVCSCGGAGWHPATRS